MPASKQLSRMFYLLSTAGAVGGVMLWLRFDRDVWGMAAAFLFFAVMLTGAAVCWVGSAVVRELEGPPGDGAGGVRVRRVTVRRGRRG